MNELQNRNDREEAVWISLDNVIELLAEVYFKAVEIVDPAEIDAYLQKRALPMRSRARDIRVKTLWDEIRQEKEAGANVDLP